MIRLTRSIEALERIFQVALDNLLGDRDGSPMDRANRASAFNDLACLNLEAGRYQEAAVLARAAGSEVEIIGGFSASAVNQARALALAGTGRLEASRSSFESSLGISLTWSNSNQIHTTTNIVRLMIWHHGFEVAQSVVELVVPLFVVGPYRGDPLAVHASALQLAAASNDAAVR